MAFGFIPQRAIRLGVTALRGLRRSGRPARTAARTAPPRGGAAGPRVLLNLVRLLPSNRGAGGAGRVALALITHLPKRVQLRVAIPPHWRSLIEGFPGVAFTVVHSDDNATLRELLDWCQCYIDPLNGLRPTRIDPRIAVIGIVLDLQHLRMPWLFSRQEMEARNAEYGYALDRSDRVVAISNYERENFAAFYDIHRTTVMHLAGFMAEDSGLTPAAIRERRKRVGDAGGYLVYPAVPWLHKNHEILVQAVALLKRRGVRIPLVLTNTGGKPEVKEHLASVAARLGVEDLVDLRAFLDEDALLGLFLDSRGMVFPTLYEGFGIPLVDAMALGVPVLTNPTSAVPEICGGAAAHLANASNALAMADDVERFWGDAGLRRRLVAKGFARARAFSSERMVASLADAVDAAIAGKAARPLPEPARFTPPRLEGLAVFVAYAGLSEDERQELRGITDIDAHHAGLFGADADVTVGLDIALADDPDLRRLFGRAKKLICLHGDAAADLDAAVEDFAARYDHAELQLVTTYRESRRGLYGAASVTAAAMALRLHPAADCAVLDPRLSDCALDVSPPEAEGVLAYDRRRRDGLSVRDVILRRSAADGHRNGTVAFLSAFCTDYARLRVPVPPPDAG